MFAKTRGPRPYKQSGARKEMNAKKNSQHYLFDLDVEKKEKNVKIDEQKPLTTVHN